MDSRHVVVVVLDDVGIAAAAARLPAGLPAARQADAAPAAQALPAARRLAALLGVNSIDIVDFGCKTVCQNQERSMLLIGSAIWVSIQ